MFEQGIVTVRFQMSGFAVLTFGHCSDSVAYLPSLGVNTGRSTLDDTIAQLTRPSIAYDDRCHSRTQLSLGNSTIHVSTDERWARRVFQTHNSASSPAVPTAQSPQHITAAP